jgi:two-component system sensor histidine kinase AlgZ
MQFLNELSAFRDRVPADSAARLAQLQARIAPHFLFNTLNTAIALVRQDPARAEGVLEDLADLFRQVLADPAESVCLSDEVALARRYLRIEQVRFGARLRVHWTLDPRADGARVPPLVLQPLVENAVHHGVQPSAQGAQVHVWTQRRGDSVVITLRNTVPQGPGPAGSGLALANVRERLHLMHDARCRFRSGLSAGVFEVQMEVPA